MAEIKNNFATSNMFQFLMLCGSSTTLLHLSPHPVMDLQSQEFWLGFYQRIKCLEIKL